MWWVLNNPEYNGIYNVGTGNARTWNDLATSVFSAMNLPVNIDYIPMPETLKDQYQYFTQADMRKLLVTGCPIRFHTLEEAVQDYVERYLKSHSFLV